jgi:hypothetical protein
VPAAVVPAVVLVRSAWIAVCTAASAAYDEPRCVPTAVTVERPVVENPRAATSETPTRLTIVSAMIRLAPDSERLVTPRVIVASAYPRA